jgi:hypothetical protein
VQVNNASDLTGVARQRAGRSLRLDRDQALDPRWLVRLPRLDGQDRWLDHATFARFSSRVGASNSFGRQVSERAVEPGSGEPVGVRPFISVPSRRSIFRLLLIDDGDGL